MYRILFLIIFAGILMAGNALADNQIKSAMSAAPASISANAKVIDWNFKTLRKGNNGWTCLPDRPDTPGYDPWCVNEPWLNFLKAYVQKEKPTYTEIGFAYMLMGDTPVSNSDPYATEPTGKEDWVTDLGPHLMMLIPNTDTRAGIAFPSFGLKGFRASI